MNDKHTVRRHMVVTMQYPLSNTHGFIVRNAGSAPGTCLHGVGRLFARLEQNLEGHAPAIS